MKSYLARGSQPPTHPNTEKHGPSWLKFLINHYSVGKLITHLQVVIRKKTAHTGRLFRGKFPVDTEEPVLT